MPFVRLRPIGSQPYTPILASPVREARYTLGEAGEGAHISLLTGRAAAAKQTVTAAKTYTWEADYVFQPRVFTELQNAQAVALPYDT